MKWSVLDQSPTSQGSSQDAAIRESLALARLCDDLGYERFWVSEHHSSGSIVGTAPEILMAAVAATTRRIRIGSAGIMLPHYSALKVAEQFRVLEAIAPGRIDLGVGRAPGSDGLTARALNPHSNAAEDFPRQVQELEHWVSGIPLPQGHPFRSIEALPMSGTSPQLWILGSSGYGAQLAAHFGLPYAFAYFFTDGVGADEALALYRKKRSRCIARITARANGIRRLAPQFACGRWRRTRKRRRIARLPAANIGAQASRGVCACRWCRRKPRKRMPTAPLNRR
jgi:luciferase family oxidoreductase group 1